MILFQYNWQVRDQWFDWCEQVPSEQLLKERTGGVESILRTLFHIVDVEQAWIRGLNGKPEFHYDYKMYQSLQQVRKLSEQCKPNVTAFIENWSDEMSGLKLDDFTYNEVLDHVIAHEIM